MKIKVGDYLKRIDINKVWKILQVYYIPGVVPKLLKNGDIKDLKCAQIRLQQITKNKPTKNFLLKVVIDNKEVIDLKTSRKSIVIPKLKGELLYG